VSASAYDPETLSVGVLGRPHGIRGEVVIVTHDPDSATLGSIDTIYIAGTPRRITQATPDS